LLGKVKTSFPSFLYFILSSSELIDGG